MAKKHKDSTHYPSQSSQYLIFACFLWLEFVRKQSLESRKVVGRAEPPPPHTTADTFYIETDNKKNKLVR